MQTVVPHGSIAEERGTTNKEVINNTQGACGLFNYTDVKAIFNVQITTCFMKCRQTVDGLLDNHFQ